MFMEAIKNDAVLLIYLHFSGKPAIHLKHVTKQKEVKNVLYIERGYKTLGKTYIHSLTAIISMWQHFAVFFFKIFMLNFYLSSIRIFQKFYNKMVYFVKRKISILPPSCFLKGCMFLISFAFPINLPNR